jgi:Predicted membrane protein
MLPNPLHPAVVHFPVVLAFLLPVAAVVAIWTIRNGSRVSRAWLVPLAVALGLSLSSWVSVETGEDQNERVERVVREQPLETHEDGAEAFLIASLVVLVVTAGGLVRGRVGTISRIAAGVGSVALVAGAAYVGHSGGQLVYKYGAASAYTSPSATPTTDNQSAKPTSAEKPVADNRTGDDQ